MKRRVTNILIFAVLYMTAASASAALITSQLNGVSILGNVYNVTFKADTGGYDYQSYNSLGEPAALEFTTEADANTAALAIAAAAGNTFLYNPGGGNGGSPTPIYDNYNGFRIAYMVDQATYNFITYKLVDGLSTSSFNRTLDAGDYLSLATFELAEVPVPAAVWLFGSALLGFSFFRKKGVRA
ncbi:MAG: PEP-CTERM sorting domain-containing protein [Sedimenticola sp.]